jgi:hypothetical protein
VKVVKREEIGAREERMRGLVFCLDSWEGMKEVSMKKWEVGRYLSPPEATEHFYTWRI